MENIYLENIQINKKNKLDGLYPTTKFLVVLLLSFSTLLLETINFTKYDLPLALIGWFIIIPILFISSGVLRKCTKALKTVFLLALFIFVVQSIVVKGGVTFISLGFLSIDQAGVQTGLSLSMLIMNIAGLFIWMFQTTSHKEISACLEEKGVNYKVAYVFVSTLKMIEILGDSSKTILNAQKARGVETEGNLIVRMKAFVPSLIPLILGAIISSEERVLTLDARGFSLPGNKTRLFVLRKSGIELIVTIVTVLMTLGVLVWRLNV